MEVDYQRLQSQLINIQANLNSHRDDIAKAKDIISAKEKELLKQKDLYDDVCKKHNEYAAAFRNARDEIENFRIALNQAQCKIAQLNNSKKVKFFGKLESLSNYLNAIFEKVLRKLNNKN